MHETGLKSNAGAAHVVGADGAAYDDLNAFRTGDFGTIYFDPAGDDVAIGGFDEYADKAGEGSDSGGTCYRGGIMAQAEQALATSFLL